MTGGFWPGFGGKWRVVPFTEMGVPAAHLDLERKLMNSA